jgi:hypothetical protein
VDTNGQATRVSRKDRLVRFDRASQVLNVSEDTLKNWYRLGFLPAVMTPGLWQTYQSWLDDVLNGTRPGKAADVAVIGRQWFAERGLTGEMAVA